MSLAPISENYVLAWNPMYSPKPLPSIFADNIARALWLGWKQQHIVDQYFNQSVLTAAAAIRRFRPCTADALAEILQAHMDSSREAFGHWNEYLAFAELLLPFALGHKVVTWTQSELKPAEADKPATQPSAFDLERAGQERLL